MHLVGFIIRIYHDVRSPERQKRLFTYTAKTVISVRFLQNEVCVLRGESLTFRCNCGYLSLKGSLLMSQDFENATNFLNAHVTLYRYFIWLYSDVFNIMYIDLRKNRHCHEVREMYYTNGDEIISATTLRSWRSGDRIPVKAKFSAPVQTSQYCTGAFPGVKRPRRAFINHLHLEPRLQKEYAPLFPLWAFVTCSRVHFTFTLPHPHHQCP